ncbi:MAG: hypothetical protein J5529_09440 [Prevotella sp.]|nr:hypothetical protein [Prevotella sp.]
MKATLLSVALLLASVVTLTSCLGGDDDEITYPSDAAINAFSLGTLNRYITTTSSTGADSTYKATVTGSNYKFYIDQVARTIYNPDSLPYGTDVKHVICNITSRNSGTVLLKNINSDTLMYYNSTDSIDFSVPRKLKVVSLDGSNTVDYTVTVNVHKEEADSFFWHQMATDENIATATGMKAVALGGKMLLFCSYGNHGAILASPATDGANWTPLSWNINMPLPESAFRNVVTMGGHAYLYASGLIYKSNDGAVWETTGAAELYRLVAASSSKLYALDEGLQLISSADEGATWTKEQLDSSSELLPATDISYVCAPSRVDADTEIITLIGNRDENDYPGDYQAQIWSKVADYSVFSTHDPWLYVNPNDMASRALPRLASLTTVSYDGALLAAGGQGRGACQEEGYQHFYNSYDGGIYWNVSTTCAFPNGFQCGEAFTMATDEEGGLWLFCSGSGQVWRGRISAGGTTNYPTAFTK